MRVVFSSSSRFVSFVSGGFLRLVVSWVVVIRETLTRSPTTLKSTTTGEESETASVAMTKTATAARSAANAANAARSHRCTFSTSPFWMSHAPRSAIAFGTGSVSNDSGNGSAAKVWNTPTVSGTSAINANRTAARIS